MLKNQKAVTDKSMKNAWQDLYQLCFLPQREIEHKGVFTKKLKILSL
jgi:hypothetical protein